MKKLLYLVFLVPVLALAQSTDQNYIKTTAYKVATLNGTTQTVGGSSLTDADKTLNLSYFDGLGRPIQQIAYKQSAEGKNIILPIVYDALGRKTKDYLPFPSQSTSLLYTDNGTSVIPALESLYTGLFPTEGQNPYSEKQLESSPLNRVQKQSAPGTDWALPVLPANPDRTIRFEYLSNSTNEVRLFTATSTSPSAGQYSIVLANVGYYTEGQLFKVKIKNENWKTADNNNNTTDEFKDKQGKVVLKRSYESGVAHDTYYAYDQYGNLTYVIPPKVNTGSSITNAIISELCYQYKYDDRNRLVEKKLPGKQWEYIVYDRMDRLVATGPALAPFTNLIAQNKKGWLITKYDAFNRIVLTAWKEAAFSTTTRKILQDLYDSKTLLSEERATSETTINGVAFKYTNQAEPTAGYHVLTINYYDDYSFTSATDWVPTVLPTTSLGQNVYYNNTLKPKGLATGSWIRVLENATAYRNERSYMLYDAKNRPILTFKRNHLFGSDFGHTLYDFEGKVLQSQTIHKRLDTATALTVNDYFTYTDQGRPLLHTHKVNNLPLELMAKNEYDKLGQLKNKKVGGADTTGLIGLQKVDYDYNIRGWLSGINNIDNLLQTGDPNDLFAFKISYNKVGTSNNVTPTALYNGNISETYWRTSVDNTIRKYGYKYDGLNRLTQATYMKPAIPEAVGSYNEHIAYDKNGNINFLQRFGYLDGGGGDPIYEIDRLGYQYDDNSNVLRNVIDESMSFDGFRDGNSEIIRLNDVDYLYDANGNMTQDWNKSIQNISYNHLNLPVEINFKVAEQEKRIVYLYNAVGTKVSKRVLDRSLGAGNKDDKTDYLGGFQYVNTILQFFPTSEGYVSVTDGERFNYVYNYTDHLGNIRLSYTQEGNVLRVLEENHYYPYGMKHSYNRTIREWGGAVETGGIYAIVRTVERGKYQYKYNGMEYQDELALNMYDMPFRDYDPAIARWTGIDPVAHYSMSPYNAFDGNPVFWADPSGASVKETATAFEFTGADAGNFFQALKTFMDGGDGVFSLTGEIDADLNAGMDGLHGDDGSGGGADNNDKVSKNSQIYKILKKIGIDNPNSLTSISYESIVKILSSPEIRKLLEGAGYILKENLVIDFKAKTLIKHAETYLNDKGKMQTDMYPIAFLTWARLALTIVHEGSHMNDYNKGILNGSKVSQWQSEVRAWRQSGTLGDPMATERIMYYQGFINASK